MKLPFVSFFLVILMSFSAGLPSGWAHGTSGGTIRAQVGANFAVQAFDPAQGFRLSPAAWRRMQIHSQTYSPGPPLNLPATAIVKTRGASSIFRLRQQWVARIPVKILTRRRGRVVVQATELQPGDQIITSGASLLRITEMDLVAGENHTEADRHPESTAHDDHDQDGGQHHD